MIPPQIYENKTDKLQQTYIYMIYIYIYMIYTPSYEQKTKNNPFVGCVYHLSHRIYVRIFTYICYKNQPLM